MRTFLEDLGRKIGETAETVTNKAGEAVELQRLRNQIRNLERGSERDYMELGRIVYNQYKEGEAIESESATICDAISNRDESIAQYEQQISEVKGDVSCDCCGKSVSKEMSYCPYCGSKVFERAEKAADSDEENQEEAQGEEKAAADKAEDMMNAAKEKAADMAEDTAQAVKEKVTDMAGQTADRVKARASDMAGAADRMKDKASDAADTMKEKTVDMAEAIWKRAEEAGEKIKQKTEK